MAEFFGKGISVGSGFDLGANLPLDNRTVQATIAERDSMPTIQLVEGLLVYVKENKTTYVLKGFDADGSNRVWEPLATGTVVEIINSLESDRTDAALSAAQGKALKTLVDELKASVAAALDYKGTKDTYEELPTKGNKKGDVWNVVAAHGTTPAGTNYAWDGAAWDPLGGTIDLSGYYTKSQVDGAISAAKTELEAADTALEGQITTVTNQLANKVDKVEGSGLISDTDLNQIRTNKADIANLQTSVGDKQEALTAGDAVEISEANVIDVKIDPVSDNILAKSESGLRVNRARVAGNNIKVGVAITGGAEIGADQTVAEGMKALSDSIKTAVTSEINTKIGTLDKADTAVTGQVVSAVSETDGIITVSRRALVVADIPTLATSKISGLDTALNGKVPTTRTVNSKPLSANVVLAGADILVGGDGTYGEDDLQTAIKAMDSRITSVAASGVQSFGGQTGAITVDTANTTNGQVKFSMSSKQLKGTVNGLKSAAYTESSAYATSAQGTKADSALQQANIATGSANGTISVKGTDVPVKGLNSAAYVATSAFDTAGAATTALNSAKAYANGLMTWVEFE